MDWVSGTALKSASEDRNTPPSYSRFARLLIFDFAHNKLWNDFYCCNLNTTFHVLGILPWDKNISKFTFLNYFFWFSHGLFVLWWSVVHWNWRISWARFRVSSAARPALIALERVRSDSLWSLTPKALSFAPQTITSLMRESQRSSNSNVVLNFFSWKLSPSSCLYAKDLWRRMYGAVLTVFTLNRPWFSFIISWIKSKCLVNFSTFLTNTCW